jgi:hypothetical protein
VRKLVEKSRIANHSNELVSQNTLPNQVGVFQYRMEGVKVPGESILMTVCTGNPMVGIVCRII